MLFAPTFDTKSQHSPYIAILFQQTYPNLIQLLMRKPAQRLISYLFVFWLLVATHTGMAQVNWATDGNSYYQIEKNEVMQYTLPSNDKTTFLSKAQLTPEGQSEALKVSSFDLSADGNQVLIFTNTKKVWRLNTRGDYWVLNKQTQSLRKLGKTLPASSLMFAKFSPDGTKVAYVSNQNIYVEDLATNTIKPLTTDGTRRHINGTFDWVYEEEFSCRDGFRWSPDSKRIAYWQIDATTIRDFYMINTTDSIYSRMIPVEYPKVGEAPSGCRIGVLTVDGGTTTWMKVPGDITQHYITRMEWTSADGLILQQLNRKQNESKLYTCQASTGAPTLIYSEKDEAWIDIQSAWESDMSEGWMWINGGKEFLWPSEKDGWRHIYRVSRDGKKEVLVTKGNFDVIEIRCVDEKTNTLYFMASPTNATQRYLYKTKLDGKGTAEQVSPKALTGTHSYTISPNGKFAYHSFSNTNTKPVNELVSLPTHTPLFEKQSIQTQLASATPAGPKVEFFKIKIESGLELDAWMVKPKNFDPNKKYPVIFQVYTEPAGQTVRDGYGVGRLVQYMGDLSADGYIYMSVDNRGTPAPRGREWRKSIYRKIGIVNIEDQAAAAREILKWPFVDPERIAVWGWSGGGSATLNLMFQHPEIYKTGIAIAAVANQLTYDNIYQERYMGLPQENKQDFIAGSPITHAKNLKGNLLYIHGTGDDNVHYQNAEMLINELIKHNKVFQLMAYPNRTHSINEGEGTSRHLATIFTNYLKTYCPPGGK